MAANYTAITIIYNPISTGSSKKNAEKLYRELLQTPLKDIVYLRATEYAGHAEELAYELATASQRPLVISSSGDGTYNEVVNAMLKAKEEGRSAVCGLLPSGNANDHYHSVHKGNGLLA